MEIIKKYFKQNLNNNIEQGIENQRRAGWLISAIETITNYSIFAEDMVYKAFSKPEELTKEEKELIIKAIKYIESEQKKEV